MERRTTEISRTAYLGRSRGFNDHGVWVIGPCLVEIVVSQVEGCTPSYYVFIDGRHQCGGFAWHLEGKTSPVAFLDLVPA